VPGARPGGYYLPGGLLDPFGHRWSLGYGPHALLVTETTVPLGNHSQVKVIHRVLQPYWLTDPNGNWTGVRFDALGMVTATAVLGKPGAARATGLLTPVWRPDTVPVTWR
jgi:hypothetical protein